jgi:hypothetical protein
VIPPAVRELAETPDRFTRTTPGFVDRHDDGRYVLLRGPNWAGVSGVRVPPGAVEALVAEVRERAEDRRVTWWLAPSVEPPELERRLRALGFVTPGDGVAELIALASVEPPDAPAADVRRVTTLDDYATASELRWEAFDQPEERRSLERKGMRHAFTRQRDADSVVHFLAYVDGRPAATGGCVVSERGLLLFGGSTADWARGRGLYRALVRARWDEAVRRGTPALVVQANPATSLPILLRLGFVEVCTQRRLEDPR